MPDPYDDAPEELAQLYAEKMARGFGPGIGRKVNWNIRDAKAAGDRRRAEFWELVRRRVEQDRAAD